MDPVSKFGEFVVTYLRDTAIEDANLTLAGHWAAPSLQSLQAALAILTPEQRELVRRVVVNSVDAGIHSFLMALSDMSDLEDGIKVMVDGEDVAKLSGWLNAESYTEQGWNARFSKFGQVPDPA